MHPCGSGSRGVGEPEEAMEGVTVMTSKRIEEMEAELAEMERDMQDLTVALHREQSRAKRKVRAHHLIQLGAEMERCMGCELTVDDVRKICEAAPFYVWPQR